MSELAVDANIHVANEASPATERTLTILNEMGDTSITWDAAQDDEMEALVARKMAQGVSFFIVPQRKPGQKGRAAKPKPLKDAAEARKHRSLSIPDADFSKFVLDGKGTAIPTPPDLVEDRKQPVRRATSAKEVATSNSVGVRARAGG
jgi:hypothetical protein